METPQCVKDFWADYGDVTKLQETTCDSYENVALQVLKTFGIPYSNAGFGGSLTDIDIKNMDAMSAINFSLLEELKNNRLCEPIVNEDGAVEFVDIGASESPSLDVYHTIQSATYYSHTMGGGVIVRGRPPQPKWKELDWKPIWGEDTDDEEAKIIYDASQMITNCMLSDFSTHATIIFDDPHLSQGSTYGDGIKNLYETSGPFEKIIGFVRFIDAKDYATNDTKIVYKNSTVVPILVSPLNAGEDPDLGKLFPRPTLDAEVQHYGSGCWDNFVGVDPPTYNDGVLIPIPGRFRYETINDIPLDKFVNVEEVLLLGVSLDLVHAGAKDDSTAASWDGDVPSSESTITLISINNNTSSMFKLTPGKHYSIVYDDVSESGYKIPYIVFAKDARINEPGTFGKDTIYKMSQYGDSGYFSAGLPGKGTVFPIAENKGILVKQIWAMVALETPSISVYDPEFNGMESKARTIAENLKYWLAPIIVEEKPAPIAFSGSSGSRIINQEESIADANPTLAQNLSDTDLDRAMTEIYGGMGADITLPFIEEERDALSVSSFIWQLMSQDDGTEKTYVCGPTSRPKLGASFNGEIINSINYTYTDSSSYTISVSTGSKLVKPISSGGPAGPYSKVTETFTTRGTVIQSVGNGIFFKVRIDKYGERLAINMSPSIIRVGDVVSCTVNNNPVEV